MFLRVARRGHRPLLGRARRLSGTRAAGCFPSGHLRESLCCGGAPLGRCPGPWFWEPRQPRKPGSDQSWVRPLLGAGTPRLPRFALDLAVLNLHLLPPHGTRWAGAAPVGERGDPPNSKTALAQPRLSGQEGPSCVHMCLQDCGHYPRCSGRPSAAGSRPRLKHAGVCSVSPPAAFVLCLMLKSAQGEEPGPPASLWAPGRLTANNLHIPVSHPRLGKASPRG